MPFEQPLANGDEDLGFLGVDVMGEEMGEDNMNMSELFINNMFDMFGVAATSPRNSPRREDEAASEGSPQRQPQHGNARYEPDEQAAVSLLFLFYVIVVKALSSIGKADLFQHDICKLLQFFRRNKDFECVCEYSRL